jgi:hypothetical protein
MKALLVAPATALCVLLGSLSGDPAAGAAPGADQGAGGSGVYPPPPFVDHTEWAHPTSLRVYPTAAGRAVAGHPGTVDAEAAGDEAWAEVLALSPNADTPGMHAQFLCHWRFAEIVQPGKTSWNLEPWRPVVDDAQMFASGCNPGGPEEPS